MSELKNKLKNIVAKHLPVHNTYEFGYAVSVELDGQPLLKHYSGNVNIDENLYPVKSDTQFDVGSIAKQFVACCIAILACEKRLDLNDSVRGYLPEMNEYADKITIRHLLSMTSGVRNVYLMKYLMSNSPLGEMEMFYRQEQPANDAGNFSSYSEGCYILLGHIVERLTGSNTKFAKARIFDSLGMTNTNGYGIMGGGGLTSTAEDLVKWHNCLMNRNLPDAPDGLFDMFFSTFTLNNGELCPYGFGFFYDDYDRDIIWQYGDMTGWQSVIRAYLKQRLSIIVLTFSDCEPVETALDLENAIIGELFDLPAKDNYKTLYYSRPKEISNIRKPDAQKHNPIEETDFEKYYGRYYGYEIDTYFDIVPDDCYFQIKYVDEDDKLLTFDNDKITIYTHGDWGGYRFPIEFYGNDDKIDFFTLQFGIGYFYFKLMKRGKIL